MGKKPDTQYAEQTDFHRNRIKDVPVRHNGISGFNPENGKICIRSFLWTIRGLGPDVL